MSAQISILVLILQSPNNNNWQGVLFVIMFFLTQCSYMAQGQVPTGMVFWFLRKEIKAANSVNLSLFNVQRVIEWTDLTFLSEMLLYCFVFFSVLILEKSRGPSMYEHLWRTHCYVFFEFSIICWNRRVIVCLKRISEAGNGMSKVPT